MNLGGGRDHEASTLHKEPRQLRSADSRGNSLNRKSTPIVHAKRTALKTSTRNIQTKQVIFVYVGIYVYIHYVITNEPTGPLAVGPGR